MNKFIKTLLAGLLFFTTVAMKSVSATEEVYAEGVDKSEIYYNDFSSTKGNWKNTTGSMTTELKDGKLLVNNTGNDSIILNTDDAKRSSGDVEIKFTYEDTRCFGLVIRADENQSGIYQSIVHRSGDNPDWSIGQPGGKWNSYPGTNLEVGKDYTMLVRYHEKNIQVFLNGEKVVDEDVLYDNGDYINGDWIGTTGLRKHCSQQSFTIDSYISGPYMSIPTTGFPKINTDMYYSNFEKDVDDYQTTVGSYTKQVIDNSLRLRNTGESIIINTKDKVRNSGDIEMDFTYETGMRCFGPTFRASTTTTGQWQVVAYVTGEGGKDPEWSIGHPGGNWNSFPAPSLENGKDYKLVVRYEGSHVQVYLNGEVQVDQKIIHGEKGAINPSWEGQVGVRKHCTSQDFTIDRLISSDYNTIPNEGLPHVNIMQDTEEGPVDPVDPVEPEENKVYYKQMRELWKEHKVGNFSESDLADPVIINHINNLNEDAKKNLATITNGATGVWDKLPSDTQSANITTQFKKLNTIARAYATPGTDLYQKPEVYQTVVDGLEYLTQDKWFDGKKVMGNWWDFQVGIPQEMVDILIIMHDDLPEESVKKYAGIVSQYVPNAERQINGAAQGSYVNISFGVTTTGANRTDLALTYLATGILLEKQEILADIVPSIESVFRIVKSGDGFYIDGSYVQHNDIPYTGSYGNIAIKGVGKILSILSDTPWQMGEAEIDTFSKLVYDSFVPLVYKGETMPMVGGRSISRAPGARKEGFGSATIYNLLIVSNFASEPYKQQLKEAAKYWILEDETDYYFNNNRDLRDILEVKAVLNDESVLGTEVPFTGSRMFASMDRFVHAAKNYSLGLSMYSSRISSFESGNNENKKGWFTADGMMYIQNQDKQYGEAFWPTVDWYRLPGTTVDTRELADSVGSFARQRSPQAYVGGATDGTSSAIAMVLNKVGTKNNNQVVGYDLKGFKSWFVEDDVIYALGAGINGTSPSSIETIVENRIMDETMNYELKSNTAFENNSSMDVKKGDWFILEADDSANNIAYVFLDDHKINLVNEARTGKYVDINGAFVNDKTYTETYQKIIIDHGKSVTDGKYAYAVLPGVTQAEVETFVNSDAQVLYNTADQQAVKVNNKTLVNIFPVAGGSVEDVKVEGAVSYVMKEDDKTITFSVTDPRQAKSVFKFALSRDRVELDGNTSVNGTLNFTVDTTNNAGATSTVVISKFADISDLEETIKAFEALDAHKLTVFSKTLYDELAEEISNVLADETVTQENVDALNERLKTFLESYDYAIDFDYVDITLDFVENLERQKYTEESLNEVDVLKEALQALVDQYDEYQPLTVTEEEVNNALVALQTAVNDLVLNVEVEEKEVDVTVLKDLIALFKTLNKSDYTKQSYVTLEAKIEVVKAYLEKGVFTELEVEQHANDLYELFSDLEKVKEDDKGEDHGNGGGSEKPTPTPNDDKDVPTGIKSSQTIMMTAFMGAVLVLFILRKRRYQ